MKKLSDYTDFLDRESDVVRRLIEGWKPNPKGVTEKEFEQDLLDYLKGQLRDVPMGAQYGIAKGKADIVIEDLHVIELKLAFATEDVAEFDRCIGQLERYRQKWVNIRGGPVYLVVVGEADVMFRDILHTWFKETNDNYATWSPFHLIEKKQNK